MSHRFKLPSKPRRLPTASESLVRRYKQLAPRPIRCPVCFKGMTSYNNLARHMTHTAEAYPQHVDFVEKMTRENFLNFAVRSGGIKRLAEILEGRKQG